MLKFLFKLFLKLPVLSSVSSHEADISLVNVFDTFCLVKLLHSDSWGLVACQQIKLYIFPTMWRELGINASKAVHFFSWVLLANELVQDTESWGLPAEFSLSLWECERSKGITFQVGYSVVHRSHVKIDDSSAVVQRSVAHREDVPKGETFDLHDKSDITTGILSQRKVNDGGFSQKGLSRCESLSIAITNKKKLYTGIYP